MGANGAFLARESMKPLRNLLQSLVVFSFAFALTTQAQAQVQGTAKVLRIKGSARYSTGNNVWQPLKVGAVVRPGTVIQTSIDKGAYVDLMLGNGEGP